MNGQKHLNRILVGVTVGILGVGAFAIAADKKVDAKKESWNEKMKEMSNVLSVLAPYISKDNEKPLSDSEKKNLMSTLDKWANLSHEVRVQSLTKESDPTLPMVATLLEEDVKRARDAFREGHHGYAKTLIASTMGHCVACHSRGTGAPELTWTPSEELKNLSNSPFEQARLLAALHQEKEALAVCEKALDRPLEKGPLKPGDMEKDANAISTLTLERLVKLGLALSVRTGGDGNSNEGNISKVSAFLDKVEGVKGLPYSIRDDLKQWRKTVESWKAESKVGAKKGKKAVKKKVINPVEHFQEAKRLFREAQKLQEYPLDRGADILFLRASYHMHQYMKGVPVQGQTAEAYLYSGMIYEVVRELGSWQLHDFFYETCIRSYPGSEVSKRCYSKLEQSVMLGFTGTAGTEVPDAVQRRLDALKGISYQKAAQPKEEGVSQ